MNCAAFSTQVMTEYFKDYGNWLLNKVGAQKSALTIHRYLPFFSEIDEQWGKIPEYKALLSHFSVARLRRFLLPMSWMEEKNHVAPNEVSKTEDSERRRIAAMQNKFSSDSNQRMLLDAYLQVLFNRLESGQTTLASARLALTSAVGLLSESGIGEREHYLPDQKALNSYLAKKPGQRASISGFVRYLREICDVEIQLLTLDSTRAARQQRKSLELELLALIQYGNGSEACMVRWVEVALPYFHGLNRNVAKKIMKQGVVKTQDGLVITCDDHKYWLPIPEWSG